MTRTAPPNYAFSALAALAAAHIDRRLTDRLASRPRRGDRRRPRRGAARSERDPPAEQPPGVAVDRRVLQLGRADGVVSAAAEAAAEATGPTPGSPSASRRPSVCCSIAAAPAAAGTTATRRCSEQSLDPFVPTTALALLALQDRPGASGRPSGEPGLSPDACAARAVGHGAGAQPDLPRAIRRADRRRSRRRSSRSTSARSSSISCTSRPWRSMR